MGRRGGCQEPCRHGLHRRSEVGGVSIFLRHLFTFLHEGYRRSLVARRLGARVNHPPSTPLGAMEDGQSYPPPLHFLG